MTFKGSIMSHKLTIKAFFFNSKTDYLPYYKNFIVSVDDDASIKEVLAEIQEKNFAFHYPKQKLIIKINGLVVEAKEPVENIVKKLGTELIIEPVKAYRANDGLKINDDDFMQSYTLLEPYATESDLKYYKTLYALHYASETENFDHSYIGDAILVLAHKMISEGNEQKDEILNAITSVHSGLLDCEYENNLFHPQNHTAAITALKEMVKNDENEHPSLLDMIKTRFAKNKNNVEKVEVKTKRDTKIIEDLADKTVAYYAGIYAENEVEVSKSIKEIGIREVQMSRKNKLSGLSILEDNQTLALNKAGITLLNAFDAGTEVLIVENEGCYDMFEKHFKKIESLIGRRMLGLELMLATDFIKQSTPTTA